MQQVRHGAGVWVVAVIALLIGLLGSRAEVLSHSFTPVACGDGRVDRILEDFDSSSEFAVFKADPSIADPQLTIVAGCHGQALAFGYDLTNPSPDRPSWIVIRKTIPTTDLSGYTHLRVALRGTNLNSHNHVEIKLGDVQNHQVTLKSLADLPAWRPIYIDFRELSDYETLDLTRITSFEIAVVRCADAVCEVPDIPGTQPTNDLTGTLLVDEFAVVNLAPGAPYREVQTAFETVTRNRGVAAKAAASILNQARPSGVAAGLVPAWFPEQPPNYNTYAQAEALLVFTYEYEQTGKAEYRNAARAMTQQLLSLQIPVGKVNAGAWYSYYDQDLKPPFRPLPSDPPQRCDGNETMMQGGQANNIDACMWVGNVGWALIALGNVQRSSLYDPADTTDAATLAAISAAIHQGAAWISGQVGRDPALPTLISKGTEGNLSAFFGLMAAGKRAEARRLGYAVFSAAWDGPLHRIKPGVGQYDTPTALDVSGSWGASLLRSLGRYREALASQGYTVSMLRTASFDGPHLGYGDIAGPYTVAVEFTAQGAVAGMKYADVVMQQLYPLQIPVGPYAGAFPGATDHWYGGALGPWSTTMAGVSPTAWVYFASSQINPLFFEDTYLSQVIR